MCGGVGGVGECKPILVFSFGQAEQSSSYMFMNNYSGNVILCIPYPKESEFSNLYKTKLAFSRV